MNVCLCVCVIRELRLTEAVHEPHICENILHYNVHAERKGSLRYAKGMSETMQTLHGLVYVCLNVLVISLNECGCFASINDIVYYLHLTSEKIC